MPIHTKISKPGIYFITFTCHKWISLIELSNGYQAVYNFFSVLSKNNHTVLAYVIMPYHIHFHLRYSGGQSLNLAIGNGKRFMAYEIVRLLHEKGDLKLLQLLKTEVEEKDRSRGKLSSPTSLLRNYRICDFSKLRGTRRMVLYYSLSLLNAHPYEDK